MAGSVAVVTGANGIFGEIIVEGLCAAGFRTLAVVRSASKGEALAARIRAAQPAAALEIGLCDLADPMDIARFANEIVGRRPVVRADPQDCLKYNLPT